MAAWADRTAGKSGRKAVVSTRRITGLAMAIADDFAAIRQRQKELNGEAASGRVMAYRAESEKPKTSLGEVIRTLHEMIATLGVAYESPQVQIPPWANKIAEVSWVDAPSTPLQYYVYPNQVIWSEIGDLTSWETK